ncbi:hypothetical protein H6G33_10595 [Calothrix sp. FACHB-1219]|uniref:hypothetical protein n=1 Tax=unclassified Calothrix TaxID=2619626 RepID=UPI0016827D7C|nr:MULTISPECIES: hypothetical protein [unclassified Calothrix]MBD2201796.1 hypothetical protein [Calothrix sp. FACHB-168]MBD2217482.1 hypothetical protein [Calothrix sp. FACHB-1219]
MAQAHPGIDAITKYLRNDFPWAKPLDCSHVYGKQTIFTYEQVKAALLKLKVTDPYLHRLLGYRWQTNRARNDIADGLYLDPSTLKRTNYYPCPLLQ